MTASLSGRGGHFFLLLKMVQVICNMTTTAPPKRARCRDSEPVRAWQRPAGHAAPRLKARKDVTTCIADSTCCLGSSYRISYFPHEYNTPASCRPGCSSCLSQFLLLYLGQRSGGQAPAGEMAMEYRDWTKKTASGGTSPPRCWATGVCAFPPCRMAASTKCGPKSC